MTAVRSKLTEPREEPITPGTILDITVYQVAYDISRKNRADYPLYLKERRMEMTVAKFLEAVNYRFARLESRGFNTSVQEENLTGCPIPFAGDCTIDAVLVKNFVKVDGHLKDIQYTERWIVQTA